MNDSDLSASELRQRYHRGGSANDDELTAAQLRARHGVASNKADFSTGDKGGQQDMGGVVLLGGLVLAALVVAGLYYNSL
mmetsp:Transcript_8936/g.15165  ORF Transcript_8936/g.15165 Transcript_8936/m.15165 type:complete len:80 (+) Transcript_8936:46-285(+)